MSGHGITLQLGAGDARHKPGAGGALWRAWPAPADKGNLHRPCTKAWEEPAMPAKLPNPAGERWNPLSAVAEVLEVKKRAGTHPESESAPRRQPPCIRLDTHDAYVHIITT